MRNRLTGTLAFLIPGMVAVGCVLAAIALTYRLNMWDIRSGWPITLWRVTMFGSFLTAMLVLATPLVRRRWFALLTTGFLAVISVLTLALALGTTSASVAGLVITLPLVIILLGIAVACTTLFVSHIHRFDQAEIGQDMLNVE